MIQLGFLICILCLTRDIYAANTTGLAASNNITIKLGFIGALDSSLGSTSTLGKELESAFKIAVELINEKAKGRIRLSTDFKSMIKDEGLDPPTTCKIAAQQLAADPDVVGVVGALRSSCSEASHQYFRDNAASMTQISYGSTSATLSNKNKFPKFFRTCASDVHQASALADLITYFNWRRVSSITSTTGYAKELVDRFEQDARLNGVRVIASAKIPPGQPDMVERKVQLVKDAQTRINLVSALPNRAQTVFQKAKEKGMTGQGWVWVGTDGVTSMPISDSQTELKESMQGTIGITPKSGSGAKYLDILVKWYNKKKFGLDAEYPGIVLKTIITTSAYVPQVFDAVYAYYLAFDRLDKAGKIQPGDSPSKLRSLVFDELKNIRSPDTGFVGAQGIYTYFDKNHDGPPVYDVVNLKGTKWDTVATWNRSLGIERTKGDIIWPGNTRNPPTDRGLPGKTTFRIGFIAPTHPDLAGLALLGKEFESAFKVAVDMMNKDFSLSVDFDIKVRGVGKDLAEDCKQAADRLAKDGVVAVIGGYRSDCSIASAKVLSSSSNRVPQISYGSTSPRLSDKTRFKYFFRTSASDKHQAKALSALFRNYRWPEVGTISTADSYGWDLVDTFKRKVEGMVDVPVRVITSQRFPMDGRAKSVRPKVDNLKTLDSKVNLISMIRNDAETVFQQIRELGMTGKGYVWLASDGATTSTFEKQKDLEAAMQGMLGTQPKNGEGSLYLKFLAAWKEKEATLYPGIVHGRPFQTPTSAAFTAQLFDAVHGVALALSDLVNKKQISRKTDVMSVRDKLFQKLKTFDDPNTGYPSATGANDVMYFDQNLDGPPRYDVVNLQGSNWITVGQYDPSNEQVHIIRDPVFPGGITIPPGPARPTYKIAAFFPKHDELRALAELGREWEAAFKIAVEHVNSSPEFKVAFSFVTFDGGPTALTCAEAAKNLPDDVDLIVGEARSTCSIAIADVTRARKIPQISYASTATKLSDKQGYPQFFRTCAEDRYQAMALSKVVERYKWERIGTIATTDEYAENLARKFALDSRRDGREITAESRFNMHSRSAVTDEVKELKSAGAAVNLISSATDDAEKIFQEAIEQEMTHKGWAWLGTDGSTSSTFVNSPNLRQAMQGMVGTRPQEGRGALFQALLRKWSEKDALGFPGVVHTSRVPQASIYVAQVFDSVLAYAHALTRLHESKLITKLTPRRLMQQELVDELKKMRDRNTGFNSAIGDKMFFDSQHDGPASYDIVNLNGNSWIKVGSYSPTRGLSMPREVVWPGGSLTPPSSKQPSVSSSSEPAVSDSVTPPGLVALGVVFGVFALGVAVFIGFLIHRERRGRPSFGPQVFKRGAGSGGPPVNDISVTLDGPASHIVNGSVVRLPSHKPPVPV
ncbi:uncharacterized protein LOC5515302 isoform X2 [Nematostella vectensis]|uniref:uncharacterized protein LOC5515302 isoform X2 n=1 Tax=Nematostella vectensis TaxID=45351 RepID=UPI002076E9B2|nr:uncharacterized protein LOC5515302 isoform X2 [Nematostella vectensis]